MIETKIICEETKQKAKREENEEGIFTSPQAITPHSLGLDNTTNKTTPHLWSIPSFPWTTTQYQSEYSSMHKIFLLLSLRGVLRLFGFIFFFKFNLQDFIVKSRFTNCSKCYCVEYVICFFFHKGMRLCFLIWM